MRFSSFFSSLALKITLLFAFLGLSACQEEQERTPTPTSPAPPTRESQELEKRRAYYALLATQADAGDSEAQRELATRYYLGQELKADLSKALFWLQKSASQNNHKAQYALAQILRQGLDEGRATEPPSPLSLEEKEAATKQEALLYQKALSYLTQAAEGGLREAQRDLGAWLLSSDYQKVDKARAIHFLTLASEAEDADSQYILGELLWSEATSAQERKKAKQLIEKSAQKQHPRALQRLPFLIE